MISRLLGVPGRNCLTADDFNDAIDHLHHQLFRLQRNLMATAQQLRDAIAAEKDAVAQNTLRVNHAIQVLNDLAKQIADLKATGGATTGELDVMLTDLGTQTAALTADDASLAAADGSAPAPGAAPAPAPDPVPVSGGASTGAADSSSGTGTVG